METPESIPDNYSSDYQIHVQQRVLESPISVCGNPFFPEFAALIKKE